MRDSWRSREPQEGDYVLSLVHHSSQTRGMPLGREPSRARPRVYLHIGEPKTGTTFLQDTLWLNRGLLAARGVALPGYERRDHVRARRDLRDERREATDLADPWAGEWDVLAAQALRAPAAAVISDELLTTCTPVQVERAVRSLEPAEIHLVLTLRAFLAVLPADWQEMVKCGGTLGWHAWLREIAATAADPDRRDRCSFWAAHDTMATIRLWERHIPPGRVHVITTPQRHSPQLLWTRLASVLGVPPGGVDLSQTRINSSLGYAETEFLRRVNEQLLAEVPAWFYTRNIKPILAQDVLGTMPASRRPALPPDLRAFAARHADSLIASLRESGCHVAGDLAELRSACPSETVVGLAAEPAEMVNAAVASAVALGAQLYQRMYPARLPREPAGGPRQVVRQAGWRMLHGPRVLLLLRRASRLSSVRRLRVTIWRVLVRPGRYRLSDPVRSADVMGGVSRSNAA